MKETDQPGIAEKVRFWQEQDRINQALIPRVLQMHELLKELSEQRTQVSEVLAATEARSRDLSAKLKDSLDADIRKLSEEVLRIRSTQEQHQEQVSIIGIKADKSEAVTITTQERLEELDRALNKNTALIKASEEDFDILRTQPGGSLGAGIVLGSIGALFGAISLTLQLW